MAKKTYVIVTYSKIPRDMSKTSDKEYMSDENNFQYDEKLIVANKLRPKDVSAASIIINLTDEIIEKNRIDSSRTYEELRTYYHSHYPDLFKALENQSVDKSNDS